MPVRPADNWRRYAVASIAVTHADGLGSSAELPAEVGAGWSETEIVLPEERRRPSGVIAFIR